MNLNVLEHIGLTTNERKVYIALLTLGTSKTGKILEASSLNSGKIYEILFSLQEKGLVSKSVKGGVQHFTAAQPEELLHYIDKKKKLIQREETNVETLIPYLKSLQAQKKETFTASTFTGVKGLRSAMLECLEGMKPGMMVYGMGIQGDKPDVYNRFWQTFHNELEERNLHVRYLFSQNDAYSSKLKAKPNTEGRVLAGVTPVAVDIFGEKVILLNYKGGGTFTLIHDHYTATSFIHFFNQLWKMAKH